MKIAGIDFPVPLLNALCDGELVIFAGAGVSRGEPARLPDFKHLAKMIAQGTGETLPCGYPIDRFLGGLQHEGVKVHERAAEILFRENLKATELHRNLLRFYSGTERVRIVTTNFDPLFEQAAKEVFEKIPEVFRAPALPSGHHFNGIVHLHGAISHPDEMVITIRDFGYAYLTGGSARRFLIELFSNFTILFVGYSYKDTIMNYLTDALPGSEKEQRFALTGGMDKDINRWHRLRIKPIIYPQSDKNDHSALNSGVCGLANLSQRKASDWDREITMIAKKSPPLDDETANLVEYALTDATRTRFFTKAATDPKWIDWLDEREYLTPLFVDGALSERDNIFGWWLIEQFVYNPPNQLFQLIDKHKMRLHPFFWHNLGLQIGRDQKIQWDKDILSRWILLLLNAYQGQIGDDTLLLLMGKCCIRHEKWDSLLQIFDAMTESRVRLKEGFLWPNDSENNESRPVNLELPLIGGYNTLNDFWTEDLKPNLSQIAEPLLDRVIKRLEEQHIILRAWQGKDHSWEIDFYGQDDHLKASEVLIYIARDCLGWLVSEQLETGARWCDKLVCSDIPLLRWLAMPGLSQRKDLTPDEKKVLGESPKFKLREPVDLTYWDSLDWGAPQSPWSPEELLAKPAADWLDDLLSFESSELNGPNYIGLMQTVAAAARTKFDWGLDLADVLSEIERWDVDLWSTLIHTWSRIELDEDKHSKVLNWLGKTELYPKHGREIADALYALATRSASDYPLNLFPQANEIAVALWNRLDRNESIEESNDWLGYASRHPAGSLTRFWLFGFLLWLDHQDPRPTGLNEEYRTVLLSIISDQSLPGKLGRTVLANLFDRLLVVDKKWTQEKLLPLFDPSDDNFYAVWDGFLNARALNPGGRNFNLTIAEVLAARFLKAVEQINSPLFNQRDLFIKDYIDILTHFVKDPIDEWIPKLFRCDSQKAPSTTTETTHTERQFLLHDAQGIKTNFASEVRLRLQVMDEAAQQEWWQRWLERYWKNRLQGVPGGEFEPDEVAHMLDWLPHLTAVFPEAVKLAVRMPRIPLRHCWIIADLSDINKSDLWRKYPKQVAELLIYLWGWNFSRYDWHSAQKLIDQLLLLDLSPEHEQGLREIKIQL